MSSNRKSKHDAVEPEPARKQELNAASIDLERSLYNLRDCDGLCAYASTLQCAVGNRCIPCAYKIANFDVALDVPFCQRIPNQRPENCPKSLHSTNAANATNNSIKSLDEIYSSPMLGYTKGTTVLTIGDGDFSFSLAVARFGCRVVATSYETKETLLTVYSGNGQGDVSSNIAELVFRGGEIAYSVDATDLTRTLPQHLACRSFQRIVWNFPCSAVAKGQDGQNQEMDHNIALIRGFIRSATTEAGKLCSNDNNNNRNCQIHINHKTKPPFNHWNIDEIVLSSASQMRYLGRVVLDRFLFPPYIPRKALDRKSFPCHDACTYIFEVEAEVTGSQCYTTRESNPLGALILDDLANLNGIDPSTLVAITPTLLVTLRTRLLENVHSNKHCVRGMSRTRSKQPNVDNHRHGERKRLRTRGYGNHR